MLRLPGIDELDVAYFSWDECTLGNRFQPGHEGGLVVAGLLGGQVTVLLRLLHYRGHHLREVSYL